MALNTSITAAGWLKTALSRVRSSAGGSDSPPEQQMALQVLLAHVLNSTRARVIAHPEIELDAAQSVRLEGLLERYLQNEPLPYLLGRWEFFGLSFAVSPATLIPRPETELLVEQALSWLRQRPDKRRAADVGTGSGCIAITLAKHITDLRVVASDCSLAALRVARQNALAHKTGRQLCFAQTDLLSTAAGPFDLVCANLPYIPHAALAELAAARYEPTSALDGGSDGLALIGRLLADAPRWLAAGGLLLLEMQYDQGEAVSALAKQTLPDASVAILADLAGLPRLVRIERGA